MDDSTILETKHLDLWYGQKHALVDISIRIPKNRITALIGPSGCGKSTLLRCYNRMNDLVESSKITGEVLFQGNDIYGADADVYSIREKIGMVFQKPNPFPKSIYENICYGPRIHGVRQKKVLDHIVETSLKGAALWDEVKASLHEPASSLSGGQQQRLCIARCLAVEPEVILMDEPCSALDPIATARIEDLIVDIARRYTVVIVTHNMQQAARVSDCTGFMYLGKLVEFDTTARIFEDPGEELTEKYITGRFG